jgi:2-polyprenyl-3-methyl-5-hydroxy-6-metoxy-1,4-benzoquinol methylase
MAQNQIKHVNKDFLLSACSDKAKRDTRIKEAHDVQCATLEKYTAVGTVLDVGAASGFFMKAAKDRGWKIYGNEISWPAIAWAKTNYNIDIDYGFLEEIQLDDNFFDAVVLWNTLEHTFNPKTTLEICYKALKINGLILIKVPNNKTGSELNKHYERVHLFEFTDLCLSTNLNKIGFKKIEPIKYEICPNYGVTSATYLYKKYETSTD